jgi:hypothetical protein
MCVSIRYAHLVPPIAFFLWVILMLVWSLYIAMRAKMSCVNPTAYKNFYFIFNAMGTSWRHSFSPLDNFAFPVDERDVAKLVRYRKIQYTGFLFMFFVVMFFASYVPMC